MKYPLIVVFDIDGTLIGNTDFFRCFLTIMDEIGIVYDINNHFIKHLKRGLCRPFIKDFIEKIRIYKNFEFVEFFIYTASNSERAYFIINCIEKAFNISFNKPIFTYNHTDHGKKSIKNIKKELLKFLIDKYNIYTIESTLRHMLVIFDDNPRVFFDKKDKQHVIIVPKYSRLYFEDIMYLVNKDNYRIIIKHINNILNYTFTEDEYISYDLFKKKYYELMYYYNIDENNINYWKDFDIEIIKNITKK